MGKAAMMAKKQAKQKKSQMAIAQMNKNTEKVHAYAIYIDQINICEIPGES